MTSSNASDDEYLSTIEDVEAIFKQAYSHASALRLLNEDFSPFGTIASLGTDFFGFIACREQDEDGTKNISYRLGRDAHLEHRYERALFLRQSDSSAASNNILIRLYANRCNNNNNNRRRRTRVSDNRQVLLVVTWLVLARGNVCQRHNLLVVGRFPDEEPSARIVSSINYDHLFDVSSESDEENSPEGDLATMLIRSAFPSSFKKKN